MQVFTPETENEVIYTRCKLCTRSLNYHGANNECYPTKTVPPPKTWAPPPITAAEYSIIPPDMFLELGQGSRDLEVLALEEAVSEDLLKLNEADQVPMFERFVKDIQIVLESLHFIENVSTDGIKNHARMTLHDTVNRSVHRGELIVAKNTSRRISEALETLAKSKKALEQRNK